MIRFGPASPCKAECFEIQPAQKRGSQDTRSGASIGRPTEESLVAKRRRLFLSQRRHRIDASGAAGRQL
jgi:hypothetical protein